MIFHVSIPADDPPTVARVVGALWRREAVPFSSFPGSFVVMAGDDRGTQFEILPRRKTLVPGGTKAELHVDPLTGHYSSTHVAIASPLTIGEIEALGERAGYTTRVCMRSANAFRVIELWLENKFLLEVLTPEMQREYLAFRGTDNVERLLDPSAILEPEAKASRISATH